MEVTAAKLIRGSDLFAVYVSCLTVGAPILWPSLMSRITPLFWAISYRLALVREIT